MARAAHVKLTRSRPRQGIHFFKRCSVAKLEKFVRLLSSNQVNSDIVICRLYFHGVAPIAQKQLARAGKQSGLSVKLHLNYRSYRFEQPCRCWRTIMLSCVRTCRELETVRSTLGSGLSWFPAPNQLPHCRQRDSCNKSNTALHARVMGHGNEVRRRSYWLFFPWEKIHSRNVDGKLLQIHVCISRQFVN